MPKTLPDLTTVQLSDIFLRVCYFVVISYLQTGSALSASYAFYMLEWHLPWPSSLSFSFFLISVNATSSERTPTIQLIWIWPQFSIPVFPVLVVSSIELITMCTVMSSCTWLPCVSIQSPSLLELHGSHLLPSIEQYDWNVVEIH